MSLFAEWIFCSVCYFITQKPESRIGPAFKLTNTPQKVIHGAENPT